MTKGTGRRHSPAARTRVSRSGRRESRCGRDIRLVVAVRNDGDERALGALVSEHRGLVERIARSNAPRADQIDDLVQEGTLGLLKAIRRYEPSRGVPFEAYASTIIAGEIRHHLRDRASCLRLPERVRELRTRLRVLAEEAEAERGRPAPLRTLADLAGVSEEAAAEAASAGLQLVDEELPTADPQFAASEDRIELGARLSRLDDREREVVFRRFFQDLTQQEIAAELGVSQMHVSRLLRGALEKMRADLGEQSDG